MISDEIGVLTDTAEAPHSSIKTQGFFFLEGHGFPPEKLEYLQAISQAILDLPQEVKDQYPAGSPRSDGDVFGDKSKLGAERGSGFKPRGYWAGVNGVRDQIDHYNWVRRIKQKMDRLLTDQIMHSGTCCTLNCGKSIAIRIWSDNTSRK